MTMGMAVFVGDIGLDLTLFVDRIPEPDEKLFTRRLIESAGGVAANAAVACMRAGISVQAWVARGDDEAGEAACDQLAREGVAVTPEIHKGPTCRCVILLEPAGEKRLLLSPGVSMHPSSAMVATADLDDVAWVHMAPYDSAAAEILASRCRERGIPWSLDLEPATFAPDIRTLAGCLNGAAAVFCNTRAAALLGPEPSAVLAGLGAHGIVFSHGAAGAGWWDGAYHAPAIPPKGLASPVDTTGAGDCLAGWFVAERIRGSHPVAALKVAVAAASHSCSTAGAQNSFPSRNTLIKLLARNEPGIEANA